MSDVKVIRALLLADSAVRALVAAEDDIRAGDLPRGTQPPAIGIKHVSGVDLHQDVAMASGTRLQDCRVQVSVLAKTYPGQKALLRAVRNACHNRRGAIAGVAVSSVRDAGDGPDLSDADTGIYEQSIDFKVTYRA